MRPTFDTTADAKSMLNPGEWLAKSDLPVTTSLIHETQVVKQLLFFAPNILPALGSAPASTRMAQQPIAIVGAGLAGLTLARCLLQRGIPTVLLEKVASSPRHSYGITLHPWAYKPLLQVLQMDERTFRRRIAVDGPVGGIGRLDPDALAVTQEADSSSFRANRAKIESLLREGLDIRWDHALTDVKGTPEGVILSFANGQRLGSSLAIGADGVHSQMRKLLLPKSSFSVLPFVVFNGKRRVSQSSFRELFAPYFDESNLVEMRRDEVLLQVSVNENTGGDVNISYTYSRPARKEDALHNPDRPTSGATDIPEEFYIEVADLASLKQPFAEAFDVTKIRRDRVLHWLMRSVIVGLAELQRLANDGVVLVGDAVHAMPILGGEGANAAIADGMELAEHLASHGSGGIADWYQARYDRWSDEMQRSEETLVLMHSDQRSVL